MSTTETPETFTPPSPDEEPEPPPETSQMVFGSGQALWLALVTVISVVALAVAIVAVAIANGEDGASGGAAAPTPTDDVSVNGGEFFFDPESVLVVADTDVRVELVNEGNLDHNWTVLEAGVTIAAEDEYDESTVLAQIGDVVAGESAEGTFTFAPGQYQVICTIAGHFSGGMRGTLEAA